MSILNKVWGTAFRNKVERLEISFDAASGPFHAEVKRLEKETAAFQMDVDAGVAAWVVTNDDGHQYDHGDDLAERRDDALEALATLRKAFTLLFYHQWERSAQHWVKPGKAPNHKDLVKAIKAAGIPLEEASLEVMRLLSNTLKPNSKEWGEKLYSSRPDLFEATFDPNAQNPLSGKPFTVVKWADNIALTDANIEEFAAAVKRSAPD